MAVCFFVNMVYVSPDAGEVLEGMFVPQVPSGAKVAVIN